MRKRAEVDMRVANARVLSSGKSIPEDVLCRCILAGLITCFDKTDEDAVHQDYQMKKGDNSSECN